MPPPIVIVANGIRADTSGYGAWQERAVRYLNEYSAAQAETFEYATHGLLFRWGQDERVLRLARRLMELGSREVHFIGHSNAADVLCRAIAEYKSVRVGQVHLFAPACQADFDANGLNDAMSDGRVGEVHIYGSPDDGALLAAKISRYVTLGLAGYGSLGRSGPENVRFPARVVVEMRAGYGHSTWFEGDHFDASMRMVGVAMGLVGGEVPAGQVGPNR